MARYVLRGRKVKENGVYCLRGIEADAIKFDLEGGQIIFNLDEYEAEKLGDFIRAWRRDAKRRKEV